MAKWLDWNPPVIQKPRGLVIWAAPHASIVHEGAQSATTYYPRRPYTEYALQQLSAEEIFTNKFRETFNLDQAFQALVTEFAALSQEGIRSAIWQWNSLTIRKSGEIVEPGLRNALDLGELLNSMSIQFLASGGVA